MKSFYHGLSSILIVRLIPHALKLIHYRIGGGRDGGGREMHERIFREFSENILPRTLPLNEFPAASGLGIQSKIESISNRSPHRKLRV